MKKILWAILAVGLLAFTASADFGPPGTVTSTVTGVSVDDSLACYATDLEAESKKLFRVWADLNAKRDAGTLTEDEDFIGTLLAQSGICFRILGEVAGTVILLDGHDYLIDYCAEGYNCIRVIQKSDGIIENQ